MINVCTTCKHAKLAEYFEAIEATRPGATCRWCRLHGNRAGKKALRNAKLYDADDQALLEAVQLRRAVIEKLLHKKPCVRCGGKAWNLYTKLGTEGLHQNYCEYLMHPRFVLLYASKLTPLCDQCAYANVPPEQNCTLEHAERMAHIWRVKALRGQGAPAWRAVAYWNGKARKARDAAERALAESKEDLAIDPSGPWFGEYE